MRKINKEYYKNDKYLMISDVKMPITLISAVFQHGIILTARVIHSFDGASLKRRVLMSRCL